MVYCFISFDGLTLVRCVCVWCRVNRNRKWVFSYVMQRY